MVMFPTSPNPNGATMNYTVVVGGGWIVLCIVYYYFPKYGGVYWFQGPMANIDQDDNSVEVVNEVVIEEKDDKYSQT